MIPFSLPVKALRDVVSRRVTGPSPEFLPPVQDAFQSAAVYIIRRDAAQDLVVPLGWK
jgi:hypothetical protein